MNSVGAAEGYRSMRRQALPPNRAKGLRPHRSLHDTHHGLLRGRPCRASLYGGLINPGFGRPCRATHPGLWGWVAPIGACSAVGASPGLQSRSPAGVTRRAALAAARPFSKARLFPPARLLPQRSPFIPCRAGWGYYAPIVKLLGSSLAAG